MESILADTSVSITELKHDPCAVIEAAGGEPVAVLVGSRPGAYLVPADTYKRLLDRLEILELTELAHSRAKERRIRVRLDDL